MTTEQLIPSWIPTEQHPLYSQVSATGRDLASSLDRVLTALPGSPNRPSSAAKALGVKIDLACRLLKAVRSEDSLSVVHRMPGPNLLRRALHGAKRSVGTELIRDAEHAIARFEELIAGDRAELDSLISGWLPDVREKVGILSRQSIFKGYSLLEGMVGECTTICKVVHPSRDGQSLDKVVLGICKGFRRVRPGAFFGFASARDSSQRSDDVTLDGTPVSRPDDIMLTEFCSTPSPRFEPRSIGDVPGYALTAGEAGSRSPMTFAYAIRKPQFCDRNLGQRPLTFWVSEENPVRRLVFDVLLHESVCPGREPALALYRASIRGFAEFGDPNRVGDLLALDERAIFLGSGIRAARTPDAAAYARALQHVCIKTGWCPDEFRVYRTEIEYPLPGTLLYMAFPSPGV